MGGKHKILAVDDSPLNLNVLVHFLEKGGYDVDTASNGLEAHQVLKKKAGCYDLILLDKTMPKMDGFELLRLIKKDPILRKIPVIIQTACQDEHDIITGIQEGAFHYLIKPVKERMLLSIVKSALSERAYYENLLHEAQQNLSALQLMRSGEFEFRSIEEGDQLASLLANICPKPKKAIFGITEIFTNAIEHGNLEISYEEKSRLLEEDVLHKEIQRRLTSPSFSTRTVKVTFAVDRGEVKLCVKDHGKGFDWKPYLSIDPHRVFDNHGRGIAMAKAYSFDNLLYVGNGSEVVATFRA